MAMFVTAKNDDNAQNGEATGEFHLGERCDHWAYAAIMLQADGDELEAIRSQFPSLMPQNHKRVIKWYGDVAKFICANLDLCVSKKSLTHGQVVGGDDHGNLARA